MKSVTVRSHPLAEIILKKLFSIETVPPKEQKRMVSRAVKAAVEYHDSKILNVANELTKNE